jgi:membrane-associated phospholipid phosphatase
LIPDPDSAIWRIRPGMTEKMNPPTPYRHLLAEIVSWAFFPPFVATVFFIFLIFWYSADLGQGVQWLVTVAPFLIVIPVIFFALAYKLGWVSDIDLSHRKERPIFLSVFTISLAVASVLLYILGVPKPFFVYAFSGLIMVIFASIITLSWKISFHTAVTTSVVTAIVILGGLHFWAFLLLVPIIGWARVALKKHSLWQVTGGALLAFAITVVTFHLFGYVLGAKI